MEKSNRRVATIKDVARYAGVSTATVSHVLNNTRYVSDDLKNKVHDSVKKLNYYPNHLVSGLRKKRSYSIGFIVPHISNETMGGLAEQIQRKLLNYGENLIICNTSYDSSIEDTAISSLIMKNVDVIVTIPTSEKPERLKEVQRRGIPVILIDRKIEGLTTDSVTLDNYFGATLAVEHLIGLGHRNICFIDRKIKQSHSEEQLRGYKDALKKAGIKKQFIIQAESYDYNAGKAAAVEAMRTMPGITAFFGYYDVIAFGAIRGVSECGKKVPEDISVIGYDAMPFAMNACPKLTSIQFPISEIAKKVFEIITLRLEEKEKNCLGETPYQNIVLQPKLIAGESTAKIE